MKKICSLIVLGVVLLGLAFFSFGCTSLFSTTPASVFDINVEKLAQNNYYYYNARFKFKCPSMDSAVCTDLKPQAVFLQKWYQAIEEAGAAIERGGKLPLQKEMLKKFNAQAPVLMPSW